MKDMRNVRKCGCILFVEDDRLIRNSIVNILKAKGYEIDSAENGFEGFELFSRGNYSAIITDLNMPIMTGIELIKKIRQKDREVKIIVTSSFLPADLSSSGWDFLFVQKPYGIDDLEEILREAFL
ncbi:response regulator [bacterium]|nr:response regulator [bacterium]